ncbi:MAG TPA: flagellar protein FlgN [Pseudogracilibacillus sp.]|nr:flagellar protein FlgN [Pseudogracilibacillus sp.]
MTITIQRVIETIEKLTVLHEQLLSISKQKTDKITESDTEGLVKLLTKERQLVQQINQVESKRSELVNQLCKERNIETEDITITRLLENLDNQIEKADLEDEVTKLIEQIVQIRESEQLNNELLQQSMQFVQLNLEMLQPETQQISYGNNAQQRQQTSRKRSVFDSKV